MEKMNDLRDLLKHEIQDLYSVEEQIIAAMPHMIHKATNNDLKRSLQEHLRITELQKARLDKVRNAMGGNEGAENEGLLTRLFRSRMVCKGMQGIIEESNKILGEDMNSDVMDAAIIACAQKIEHYEICGYGTAKAYARELNLPEVERLLDQTLNEEYNADDHLTALAVGRLNKEAEAAGQTPSGSRSRSSSSSQATERSGIGARVRETEPEMEMASRKTGASATRSNASNKGASAPKGSTGGRGSGTSAGRATPASAGRGAAASKSAAAASKATGKSSTGTARTASSGSRAASGSRSSTGRSGSTGSTRNGGSSRNR